MQIKSILFSAVALASVVAAYPSGFDERIVLVRRTDEMNCGTHNKNVLCATTHQCSGGRLHRKPGSTLNGWCGDECRCRSGAPSPEPQAQRGVNKKPAGKGRR